MSEYTGTFITNTGQSAEIVYAFANCTAATDITFTRTDTNAALTAKDGYLIRVLGVQFFGGAAQQTVTLNTKPSSGAGVAISPTITVAAATISEFQGYFGGYFATKENETLTATASGALGIMVQLSIEAVTATTTTTPITPPTPPPTAAVDWDPTVFVYKDAGGNLAGEGDGVYQWNSKIGAYIATQAITARRPTYRESVFNGKPGLEFYLDDILPVATGSMQSLVNGTNTEFTLFLVVKYYNTTATQIMLGFADNAAANPTYRFGAYLGTNWVGWKTDDAGTSDNLASGSIFSTDARLLTFVVDNSGSGLCSLWVRQAGDVASATDAATATNTTFNGGALTATNATFGAVNTNSTNSLFCDAYLGRCIMYASELSAEQRAAVENELIGLYL